MPDFSYCLKHFVFYAISHCHSREPPKSCQVWSYSVCLFLLQVQIRIENVLNTLPKVLFKYIFFYLLLFKCHLLLYFADETLSMTSVIASTECSWPSLSELPIDKCDTVSEPLRSFEWTVVKSEAELCWDMTLEIIRSDGIPVTTSGLLKLLACRSASDDLSLSRAFWEWRWIPL